MCPDDAVQPRPPAALTAVGGAGVNSHPEASRSAGASLTVSGERSMKRVGPEPDHRGSRTVSQRVIKRADHFQQVPLKVELRTPLSSTCL